MRGETSARGAHCGPAGTASLFEGRGRGGEGSSPTQFRRQSRQRQQRRQACSGSGRLAGAPAGGAARGGPAGRRGPRRAARAAAARSRFTARPRRRPGAPPPAVPGEVQAQAVADGVRQGQRWLQDWAERAASLQAWEGAEQAAAPTRERRCLLPAAWRAHPRPLSEQCTASWARRADQSKRPPCAQCACRRCTCAAGPGGAAVADGRRQRGRGVWSEQGWQRGAGGALAQLGRVGLQWWWNEEEGRAACEGQHRTQCCGAVPTAGTPAAGAVAPARRTCSAASSAARCGGVATSRQRCGGRAAAERRQLSRGARGVPPQPCTRSLRSTERSAQPTTLRRTLRRPANRPRPPAPRSCQTGRGPAPPAPRAARPPRG